MKVTINHSITSTTGYELRIIKDDGTMDIKDIDTIVDEGKTLKLPENPSNRKYYAIKKVEDADEVELTYKASITLGTRENSEPKKPLEDYLEGDDRILYLELVEKAKKKRAEMTKKPMTELEKAEAKVARLMAQIEEMKKNGAEA